MKSIISLAVLASVSLAQDSIIGLPTAGYTVTKGGNMTVQVQRPVCCASENENGKSETNLTCVSELLGRHTSLGHQWQALALMVGASKVKFK
jgi:hypothetical protein